ncbi:MAG: tRNA (adenosine(37)-N6)-threonylcarbamoyltransferase complex dimerization subunit type 1 TsaB [Gammaproteobacteria bacterium]|nr:tRNA (adenosine(37)-N6)-threonylcarbamoyltransferase complex dimerization subunit type 1 TsaB [Gammaproteobacteria bacterium]
MTILAIDASTELCSAALDHQGQITAIAEICPRGHSQRLPQMVDQLLTAAGISLADVDLLAVGRGPGGFTGVRIGIGYGMGLALAANLPVVGISTLEALAEQARQHGVRGALVTALDARMGELYIARWQLDEQQLVAVGAPGVAGPEQLQPWAGDGPLTVVGSALTLYGEALRALGNDTTLLQAPTLPEARAMLALAERARLRGETGDISQLEPLYLRNNVVHGSTAEH